MEKKWSQGELRDVVRLVMEQQKKQENKQHYETEFGISVLEKPENMTHLRGNYLVLKTNSIIALRGALDTLESEIILLQVFAKERKRMKLVADLEAIIVFLRQLMRCEITGESVGEFHLLNLSADDLREHSHHPSKYYGISHFLPTYEKGEIPARLNRLRTQARETELAACHAFTKHGEAVSRTDIIQALNRLSSLFWIMIFRYLTGEYEPEA